MGSAGLSPHVVVAFSVFLRLAGYAELLVTCDRQRSKRLLRLAMGVTSDHGMLIVSAFFSPAPMLPLFIERKKKILLFVFNVARLQYPL